MADIEKKVEEIIDFLDQEVVSPEVGESDALKIFVLQLISEYFKNLDYYAALGFLEDVKNEWTRLNIDKVETKEIEDNQNN